MKVVLGVIVATLLTTGTAGAVHMHSEQVLHKWQHITNESVQLTNDTLDSLGDCIALVEGTKK